MIPKPMFIVTVLEHGSGAHTPTTRLRFTRQDHTVPPVDFYLEGGASTADQLEGLLAELKGSELDPGAVVERVTRDYDLQECAMRIFAQSMAGPDQWKADECAQWAFNAAGAFIREAKRREAEE